MSGRPWNAVRIALSGVLAALTAALVVPNVSAQLGRPGAGGNQNAPSPPAGPPVGMGGQGNPGVPGGPAAPGVGGQRNGPGGGQNAPSLPGGPPVGLGGAGGGNNQGYGNMPDRPDRPGGPGLGGPGAPPAPGGLGGGMPQPPRPGMPGGPDRPDRPGAPGGGGMGGPFGPPGGFGGPRFENVWKCGKCQREIDTGAFPPATCPHCGVHLINGMGNGDKPTRDNPGGFNALPGGPAPGPQAGAVDDGRGPAPLVFGGGAPAPQAGQIPGIGDADPLGQNGGNWRPDHLRELDNEQDKSERAKKDAEAARRTTFWTVLGIVGGVGVLLIVGMVVFGILAQSGSKKKRAARRPKRRPASRRYEDDDEDD
ncbi:MAG: hypothetical protein ABGY75_17860, partial [Gemmataceae bacterium]